MQLAIFGNTSEAGIAPEWTDETAVAIFGSTNLDLTRQPPLSSAVLKVAAIFGSAKIVVPPGARVTTKGFALVGNSRVRVEHGAGPELQINFLVLFGEVKIVEGVARAIPAPLSSQTFPY
jgi:predicted membrane protein